MLERRKSLSNSASPRSKALSLPGFLAVTLALGWAVAMMPYCNLAVNEALRFTTSMGL